MLRLTFKTLVAGLALASISAFANNPQPTIKADAPNRYVVKKGDTLWDISGKYLDAPHRWREIWATNRQIKNPHLIYPNDILILCIIKGQTLVGVDTGEGCAGIERQMTEPVAEVTINSYENSIPAIPLGSIRHWLDRSIIVHPNDFKTTPYILASRQGNLITATGNKVYAKGALLAPGQSYGIYREGKPYIDQRTGMIMGLEVTQVATATVTSVTADGVSSLQITNNYGSEVREGDRVFIEVDAPIPSVFYPAPASVNRGGMIARVMGSIGAAAKDSVVAVNLGATDGAQPGHVLDVYKKGALIRDVYDKDMPVRLPSELLGQVIIFKTFDYISYAYVLSAEEPLNVGDYLVAPQVY